MIGVGPAAKSWRLWYGSGLIDFQAPCLKLHVLMMETITATLVAHTQLFYKLVIVWPD